MRANIILCACVGTNTALFDFGNIEVCFYFELVSTRRLIRFLGPLPIIVSVSTDKNKKITNFFCAFWKLHIWNKFKNGSTSFEMTKNFKSLKKSNDKIVFVDFFTARINIYLDFVDFGNDTFWIVTLETGFFFTPEKLDFVVMNSANKRCVL